MRLYAYGGNGHVERARAGHWPGLDEAALSNRDDVRHGDTFGVGLSSEGPHLVFRTLVTDSRDGYAYTLLLGPEEATWEAFSWNPAALLRALLKVGDAALMQPDRLARTALLTIEQDACRGLSRPAPGERQAATGWGETCVGTALAGESVVIDPSLIGLPGLPKLAGMDALCEALPPAFRIGAGWLAGGNRELARTLRACFTLGGGAPAAGAAAAAAKERGRRLLESWAQLPHDLRERYEAVPMHCWPFTSALEKAFAATEAVAAGADLAPELTAQDTPFAAAIQDRNEALLRARLRRCQPLQPHATASILSLLERQPTAGQLTPAEADALDPAILRAFLRSQGVPPAPSTVIRLSPEAAAGLAAESLHRGAPLKLADYLACVSFLAPYGAAARATPAAELERCIEQGNASVGDLLAQAAALQPPVAAECRDLLMAILHRRMQQSGPAAGWLHDAIVAELPASTIRERLIHAPAWEEAIRQLLHAGASSDAAGRRWLALLPTDPVLRHALSLDVKRELAKGSSEWQAFRTANALFRGGDEKAAPARVSEEERSWLLEELAEMARGQDWRSAQQLPRIGRLAAWLQLPPDTLAVLDRQIAAGAGLWQRWRWRWMRSRMPKASTSDKREGRKP